MSCFVACAFPRIHDVLIRVSHILEDRITFIVFVVKGVSLEFTDLHQFSWYLEMSLIQLQYFCIIFGTADLFLNFSSKSLGVVLSVYNYQDHEVKRGLVKYLTTFIAEVFTIPFQNGGFLNSQASRGAFHPSHTHSEWNHVVVIWSPSGTDALDLRLGHFHLYM